MYNLFYKLCIAGIIFHFLLISVNMLPDHWQVKKIFRPILRTYISYPITQQSWKMFSSPPQFNSTILVSFESHHKVGIDTSEWIDIYTPLVTAKKDNPVLGMKYGCTGYFLFHCTQEIRKLGVKVTEKLNAMNPECSGYEVSEGQIEKMIENTKCIGDIGIINYSKYLLANQQLEQYLPTQIDSLFLRYRVVMDEFPKFEERFDDSFNNNISYYERPKVKIDL